jgi:hypothetical protein
MLRKRWMWFGIAAIIAMALWAKAVEWIVQTTIDRQPEVKLCQEFVLSSTVICELFGELSEATVDRSEFRSTTVGNRSNGFVRFNVSGANGKGILRVYWDGQADGRGFEVKEIELVRKVEPDEVIWTSDSK